MSNVNMPVIGDVILSPHEKFNDGANTSKYDQLVCDGSELDVEKYPILAGKLGDNELPDTEIPYNTYPTDTLDFAQLGDYTYHVNSDTNYTLQQYDDSGIFTGLESVDRTTTGLVRGVSFDKMSSTLYGYSYSRHIHKYDSSLDITESYAVNGISNAAYGLAMIEGVAYILDIDVIRVFNLGTPDATSTFSVSGLSGNKRYITSTGGNLAIQAGAHIYVIDKSDGSIIRKLDDVAEYHEGGGMAQGDNGAILYKKPDSGEVVSFGGTGGKALPDMTSPSPLTPYRITADLSYAQIGDIVSSDKDKYKENGVDKYDQLICDGSELDTVNYPLLSEFLAGGAYTGVSFSVLQYKNGLSLTRKDNLLWISTISPSIVFECGVDGTYTGNSIDLSGQMVASTGICWVGDTLYAIDYSTGIVHTYNISGGYLGVAFDLSQILTGPFRGLEWDGVNFWTTTEDGHATQVTSAGALTGVVTDRLVDSPTGVTTLNGDLLVSNNTSILKFSNLGVSTDELMYIGAEDVTTKGITEIGGMIYTVGERVYEYLSDNFGVGNIPDIPATNPSYPPRIIADLTGE